MANDWAESTLGDVCDLLTGFPFKSANYTDANSAICLVRGDNIIQGRLRWDGVKKWPSDAVDGLQQYYLQEDDVVLAMDRPWIEAGLKYAAISKHDLPALLVQRVSRLRGGSELDTRFLKYLIGSEQFTHHVLAVQTGTAVPHISAAQIKSFSFRLPPVPTQQRIADILGTLDDKIELNRRMNETLEAMARRLFRSWFVDFDPVHAKARSRREHPKISNADLSRRALPNMAPEIAELFPDSFEDSTLGPIPKGWKAGPIGDLALLDKSSVKPSAFPDEVFDHYSIPAFDDGMNPVREPGDQIKSNKFIVTPDCVLLTKLNPRIPRVWLPFPSYSRRSLCSTEFLVLKPNPGIPREFLFSLVSSRTFFEVYETMVTGTSGSHQRIRPEHLLNMEVVIPPAPFRTSFSEAVRNQFTHSESLRSESRRLAATRDRLLPKLLSGELSVSSEVA